MKLALTLGKWSVVLLAAFLVLGVIVKAGGGMDKMRIAFYQSGDLDDDQVWDIWRLEGPTLVCHFRGTPHVHAYINVRKREKAKK